MSRKQIDELEDNAKKSGAKGLIWIAKLNEGFRSTITKYINQEELDSITERLKLEEGDITFIIADKPNIVSAVLGKLRLEIARRYNKTDKNRWEFLWIMEFPLFEYNPEEKKIQAMHNIVTQPYEEDLSKLDEGFKSSNSLENPQHPWRNIRARQYDLVLNGTEIASGGIRNHKKDIQLKILNILGWDEKRAQKAFGFLLDALEYGAPPHGGIAPGLDRIVALICGMDSIREVIAFPKTTAAQSLMDGAPAEVEEEQLRELGIKIIQKKD